MLPRPDSQSFTRFTISAGVFLVVAAFVFPGLVLRDIGVLTITRGELHAFTPTARGEIERRQDIARDAGEVAPFFGGAFLVGGLLLIAFGAPRLLRRELKDDERSAMELDKLRVELRPQTVEEREERLQAEIDTEPAEGASDERGSAPKPQPPPPGRDALAEKTGPQFSRSLRERARTEAMVLKRLKEIEPSSSYELQTQVKLEGDSPLLLDGLFISRVNHLPDIVVEIKFSNLSVTRTLKNRLLEAQGLLLQYIKRYRRQSIGWLIVVAEEDPSEAAWAHIDRAEAEAADFMRISVVTPNTLGDLALPIEL